MRVTYLMRCLAMMRGGGETQHLSWMRALRRLGVEIDVITGQPLLGAPVYPPEPDLQTTTLRSPYMRDVVYRVQSRRGFGRLSMWALHGDEELFCRLAFNRIAERAQPPDLVLAHALHQAPRLAPHTFPVAVYLPGPPHPRYVPDLRQADGLISDGWAAKQLPAMIGRPVYDVLKGVDVDTFTPIGPHLRGQHALENTKVVICVTRLVPIKNLRMMIDAIAVLRQSRKDVVLVLVGEGPQQAELQQRVRALDLGDAVRFAGYVPQQETASWYRTANVFALSSDFDNSPNVVLEAMAAGLPVVATDVGGLGEYITEPRNGRLTPKGDAQAFAAALRAYLDDDALARATGEANRVDALSRFSWAASAAKMREVYAEIITQFRDHQRTAQMKAS